MSTIDRLSTPVDIEAYLPRISFTDPVCLAGSCFTEHIGDRLQRYKHRTLCNPFGIVYNSYSIASSFERIAAKQHYQAHELVVHDGLFHSMDHHGSFSGPDSEAVLQRINGQIDAAFDFLKTIKFAFISPGTSIVYRYHGNNSIVANNHKLPSDQFTSEVLTVDQCTSDMVKIYKVIKHLAPAAHVIVTVSPVRHLRDGLVSNQRSKSVLILAAEDFVKNNPDTGYFPAYEIMMDQLRDYRFYDRDMIHPSPLAIDIIWESFCNTYLDPSHAGAHRSMEKVYKGMQHRILQDNKAAVKVFAQSMLREIDHLAFQFPDMDWKNERQYFFHLIEPD